MAWKSEAQRKSAIKRGRLKLMDLVDPEILITLPFVVPEPHELVSDGRKSLSRDQQIADEEVVAISVAVHSALNEALENNVDEAIGSDAQDRNSQDRNSQGRTSNVGKAGDSVTGRGEFRGRNVQPEKLVKERYSRDF